MAPKRLFLVSGVLAILLLWLLSCGGSAPPSAPPPPPPHEWKLTWSDEFDGLDGSAPDPTKWNYDQGWGEQGWGNNELETYTNRLDNAYLQGGNLVIEAKQETYTNPADGITKDYTSARLKTEGLFAQAYGRFEARLKVPYGQGMWPAFWLLGNNIVSVGWPTCGEIDVMENIGREPSTVYGSIHAPSSSGTNSHSAAYTLPSGQHFSDDFHVFALEWDATQVRFYVDGHLYQTVHKSDVTAGGQWVFDLPFFIILNVAVGGSWPGSPDATTVFPQQMLVDYVRVYQ